MPPPRQRSKEWIEARRSGIGASDIAVLAGLTTWSSPYQVYLEKRGEIPPADETAAMARGNLLEEPVAQWWARDTGNRVRRRHAILEHPTIVDRRGHHWVRASLDREVVGKPEVLEVKTTAERWDEPPEHVIAQVQWQLGVTGTARAHIAALTGGLDLVRWEVLPDRDYFLDLVAIGEEAWAGVVEGRPPAIDGSDATRVALTQARARSVIGPELVPADPAMVDLAWQFRAAEEAVKDAEAHRDTIANAVRAILGEAPGVVGPGFRITWSQNRDGQETEWEAVARDVGLADPAGFLEAVAMHTHAKPGAWVLRKRWDEPPAIAGPALRSLPAVGAQDGS